MSENIVLNVQGMKCGGCENNVRTKLELVDGILSVSASHQNNQIDVEYDPANTNLEIIKAQIQKVGYQVE